MTNLRSELQMGDDEWEVLQEILQPDVAAAAENDVRDPGCMTAGNAIPMPDLVAADAASGRRAQPSAAPAADAPGAASQDADFSRRLARLQSWPAALRERDFSELPAPALGVQIFRQPMPDGRLATVVRCTEESSMRMDPREVAAQLVRLCGALASGALSLDSLGAAADDSLPPLPACLVDDDADGRPERASATTAMATGSRLSQKSPQLEVHECRDGHCKCVRKRSLHLQHSRISRRAPEASRPEAALPEHDSFSQAARAGSSAARAPADDGNFIMHQSVSASGVMSMTLRPSQPNAVEDPERRLLANQAFLKAKAARERPDEAASSSSEDEATLIRSLLHKATASGRVQPGQAEAAAAVLASSDGGADEPQPAAQGGAAEAVPLRKHEAVRRISVDFLDRGGYFDRPIQDAATELRVSATTLKKICRAQGVQRWPYKKRNHVQQLLKESAQLVSHKPAKKRDTLP